MHSDQCTVWEYDFPSKDFSLATALINGRYPAEKRSVNLECQEVYYVLSGSGTIHSDQGDFEVSSGDLYFFEKAESYWIDGHELTIVLVNAPKWSAEQYRLID